MSLVTSEIHKFVPDENFTSPPSPQTDDAWMKLLGRKF